MTNYFESQFDIWKKNKTKTTKSLRYYKQQIIVKTLYLRDRLLYYDKIFYNNLHALILTIK